MVKKLLALIAAAAVLATFSIDTALAAKATTDLSIKIEDATVGVQDTIVVTGKLTSAKGRCVKNKTVYLYIDGGLYGETTTDDKGNYQFQVNGPHPTGAHEFKTKFMGTRRCKPSSSGVKNVTVE